MAPCLESHRISRSVLPAPALDTYIASVFVSVAAGVAGASAGQSIPCSLLRRPQEAGQSPIVPPQQQCVQLPSPHRKLLRQDTYVSSQPHSTPSRPNIWWRKYLWVVLWVMFPMSLLFFLFILSPAAHHNGLSMNHALLGLSPNIPPGPKEGDLAHDMSHEAAAHKRMHTDKGESGFI